MLSHSLPLWQQKENISFCLKNVSEYLIESQFGDIEAVLIEF